LFQHSDSFERTPVLNDVNAVVRLVHSDIEWMVTNTWGETVGLHEANGWGPFGPTSMGLVLFVDEPTRVRFEMLNSGRPFQNVINAARQVPGQNRVLTLLELEALVGDLRLGELPANPQELIQQLGRRTISRKSLAVFSNHCGDFPNTLSHEPEGWFWAQRKLARWVAFTSTDNVAQYGVHVVLGQITGSEVVLAPSASQHAQYGNFMFLPDPQFQSGEPEFLVMSRQEQSVLTSSRLWLGKDGATVSGWIVSAQDQELADPGRQLALKVMNGRQSWGPIPGRVPLDVLIAGSH